MAFFSGSIYKADGGVCCEGVMVSLEQPERAASEWYGTVSASETVDLVAGERYRLVLADGRTGEFRVRRNTAAGGRDRAVAIQGLGPLTKEQEV